VRSGYSRASGWPGVQLYYPPIKYLPREKRYENELEAATRLAKYANASPAHSIIFDLEDGCRQKSLSRSFLRAALPELRAAIPGRVALRINAMQSEENLLDLTLLEAIAPHVDDVMLAKAGEVNGRADVEELAGILKSFNDHLLIQPIIEHPRSYKIADEIFCQPAVQHVVFGIHDFSKAMHMQIDAENWQSELYPFMCQLLIEARIAGKGLIGGVETLLLKSDPPALPGIAEWLQSHSEPGARIIHRNALREASMGYTGKQVIHPTHIPIIRHAFEPGNEDIYRNVRILEEAMRANAFLGGAIRFEDEMMDPPMFAKALQVLLRSRMLGNTDTSVAKICDGIRSSLPAAKAAEIWPYPG
jgi:citrate lyase subunit beta / citryl-CoA lyase